MTGFSVDTIFADAAQILSYLMPVLIAGVGIALGLRLASALLSLLKQALKKQSASNRD